MPSSKASLRHNQDQRIPLLAKASQTQTLEWSIDSVLLHIWARFSSACQAQSSLYCSSRERQLLHKGCWKAGTFTDDLGSVSLGEWWLLTWCQKSVAYPEDADFWHQCEQSACLASNSLLQSRDRSCHLLSCSKRLWSYKGTSSKVRRSSTYTAQPCRHRKILNILVQSTQA